MMRFLKAVNHALDVVTEFILDVLPGLTVAALLIGLMFALSNGW